MNISENLSGREAYRNEITKLAFERDEIICIEADLGGKNHPFQQDHPERFFNIGIAELAGIDLSAGLAAAGFIPFFSTFAPFAALRGAESIKLALGYMSKNIKIVAPYGGVSGGWFGTTHHCLEDISIIQSFQNIRIACPHGELETRNVIREAADSNEPYYIRLSRNDKYSSLNRDINSSCREILFEGNEQKSSDLCLISIGEQATNLCEKVRLENSSIVHAHLCYVDIKRLKTYVDDLRKVSNKFVVVEEHRATGSIASCLALLMPDCQFFSHNCGEDWPIYGGTHADVLEELGFGLEPLMKQINRIGD